MTGCPSSTVNSDDFDLERPTLLLAAVLSAESNNVIWDKVLLRFSNPPLLLGCYLSLVKLPICTQRAASSISPRIKNTWTLY